MKLRRIIESRLALQELAALPLNARTAFRNAGNVRDVSDILETYEKTRRALVERLGTPVEGQPGQFTFEGDKREELEREHDALLDTEVEINVRHIKLSEIEDQRISSAVLAALDWLVTEE